MVSKVTAPEPTVSVVIPTHNRANVLGHTLRRLSCQTYPSGLTEVIVVADGCIDETVTMLHSYTSPFKLKVIERPGEGSAAARNHGANAATGQLLVFLDDDIEATPDLLASHVLAHGCGPERVVIGYLPPALIKRRDFFGTALRSWWEAMFERMREPGCRFAYTDLLSGNVSLKTDLFHRVGGFDPDILVHHDYELGLRLIKAGATLAFAPNAKGIHHDQTTLERLLRRKYDEGRDDILLGQRYSELRPSLLLNRLLPERPSLALRLGAVFAVRLRGVTDLGARSLQRLLPIFETLRMRRRWRHLVDILMAYWYFRGAADSLGSVRELNRFLAAERSECKPAPAECEIDLAAGIEEAEATLDARRPNSALLRYGQQFIGLVPAVPGAEPLRGVHLRPLLAGPHLQPYQWALVLDGRFAALSTRATPDPPFAAHQLEPRHRVGLSHN